MVSSNDFLDQLIQQLSNGNGGMGFSFSDLDNDGEDQVQPDVCTEEEWEKFCNEMCLEEGRGENDLGF